MKGYIKLQRRFFDHWLWDEKRTFSKAEAWLDLLQIASFTTTKRVVQGKLIRLEQGECIASVRYLAERWGWGKDKAAKYLLLLESDEMIRRMSRQGETIISLCKYKDYASMFNADADTETDREQTESRQTPDRGQTKYKKDKKEKKGESMGEVKFAEEVEHSPQQNLSQPSLDEVLKMVGSTTYALTKECAEAYWNDRESVGWLKKGQPIANWRADIAGFSSRWMANERNFGSSKNNKQDTQKHYAREL